MTVLPVRPRFLRAALTPPGMVPAPDSVEDDTMTQYTIKVLNYPDPPAEEEIVSKAVRAYLRARRWARGAETSGIEALLLPKDRSMLQALIAQVRDRRLLSPDGCEAIVQLAGSCAARIADLANPDAPETRRRALLLHDMDEELRDLAELVGEVLDLRAALEMRHRIRLDGSGPRH